MAIVNGRHSPQRRAVRKDGWSVKKRKIFLDTLATTGHVRHSEAAAGMSKGSAYDLKKRDGEFAGLWTQALEEAAERLDEETLAYAMGAPTGDNPQGEREPGERRPFDPVLALKVLKWRRDSDRTTRRNKKATYATQAEVDFALMAALEELAGKLGKSGK